MAKDEILSPVEFAIIREYGEAEATIDGIAKVTGLSRKVVTNVLEAPHYKAYMEGLKKIHRQKIKEQPATLQLEIVYKGDELPEIWLDGEQSAVLPVLQALVDKVNKLLEEHENGK